MIALPFVLAGCASRPKALASPQDVRLHQLGRSGVTAFKRGEYEQARSLFERALARAYLRDDLPTAANHAYHLAASLMRLQRYEEAMRYVNESRLTSSMTNGSVAAADLDLLEAAIHYRRGALDEALAVLGQSREDNPQPGDAISARSWLLESIIASKQGNSVAATNAFRKTHETPGAVELPDYWMANGYIMLDFEPNVAASDFDKAAELYREVLDYEGMTRALRAAAETYVQVANQRAAAERFLRAGRSCVLQERPADARAALEAAITAADAADRPALAAEARKWLAGLPSEATGDDS